MIIRTSISLEKTTFVELNKLAKQEKRSISNMVTFIIDKFIEDKKKGK